MKKIDFHCHILPENIPNFKEKFGYGGFIYLDETDSDDSKMMMKDSGEKFRLINCNCYNPIRRIEEYDANNPQNIQVLSIVPVMFSYWAKPKDTLEVSQFLNNHIRSICKKYPDKCIGLGTLPMNNIDYAILELKRCVNELGLKGIQIGTNVNGKNLDDPIFFPLYKEVERLNIPVFVHPWDMLGGDRFDKHWLKWLVCMPTETCAAISCLIFGGIFKKFPNLKMIFAHGGGSFIGTFGRIQKGFDCRPDLFPENCSPKDYLKNIYLDSLVHDEDMLIKMIKTVGSDNIVLGTDYPFPLGEQKFGNLVESSSIKDEIKEKILWRNADKLLRLNSQSI